MSFDVLHRKFETFRKDPVGILRSKIEKSRSYRQVHDRVVLRFPFFDICRFYVNRAPKQLYLREKAKMGVSPVEAKILSELQQDGISATSFEELFPSEKFANFQDAVEELLRTPEILGKIEAIEKGQKTGAQSKFYLVKPLGGVPVFDARDEFLRLALSEPLLRVVCAYLDMFARLIHIEHWYNVPTPGEAAYSQRWHRDPDDKRLVKTFMYLRDVDETTGPFTYVPGSQNGGPHDEVFPQTTHESHYPPDGAVDGYFSPSQVKVCTGKAGTIVLCDTSGLHKGGHPTRSPRLLFTCSYTSNAAKVRNDILYSISNPRILSEHLSPAGRFAIGHPE